VPNLGGCGGNCAPLANSLSVKLQMDSSILLTLSAEDHDGAVITWEIVELPTFGALSGTAPNVVYTPNANTAGTDSFSFRVVDDSGELSNIASVTLEVQDCNLIDIFQVPSTYPVFSGSYNYVHVSEDGPSLDNTKTPAHNVQWQNPGLYQFSLELEVAPYYLDVLGCMTNQALSGSRASFTLSGCGISGLDGEYWITQQDGNEIWVEKNNGWALVFTNDASYTPEFCRSSGPPGTTPPTTSSPTKPPTKKPTVQPTNNPTPAPTNMPTPNPTPAPTHELIPTPTEAPVTSSPTGSGPTTADPTSSPSRKPSKKPTLQPTNNPTKAPTSQPTPNPTNQPTAPNPTSQPTTSPPKPSPTPSPNSGGTVCCTDRNLGYQTCTTNLWCEENANQCSMCGGVIMSVPLIRTGCCSWYGECSGSDPTSNMGCQYMQSDCEGSCGGTWQLF